MSTFEGRVVAITGAGSGIGRALALGAAQRGARLSLADWDAAGLAETASMTGGRDILTAKVDVSDRAAVAGFAAATAERFGVVHQIYNNAGVGGADGRIGDVPYDDIARLLSINLWGVIHGTTEFLPHLIASGEGHVVNVSSLNGFMAQPEMAAYVTSKFAVRGFTETLRAEMLLHRLPVRVTVVHPGGVKTAITEHALPRSDGDDPAHVARRKAVYDDKLFRTTADAAATKILDGVAKGRGRVLIGQARAVDRLVRALPSAYPRLIALWHRRTFGD